MDALSVYRTLLTPSSCIQSILELTQLHIIVSKYKHQHMYFTKKFLIALFYRDCQHHLQLDVIVSATFFCNACFSLHQSSAILAESNQFAILCFGPLHWMDSILLQYEIFELE